LKIEVSFEGEFFKVGNGGPCYTEWLCQGTNTDPVGQELAEEFGLEGEIAIF
jgi:hypothetical protein